jgi:hypothetical protein
VVAADRNKVVTGLEGVWGDIGAVGPDDGAGLRVDIYLREQARIIIERPEDWPPSRSLPSRLIWRLLPSVKLIRKR